MTDTEGDAVPIVVDSEDEGTKEAEIDREQGPASAIRSGESSSQNAAGNFQIPTKEEVKSSDGDGEIDEEGNIVGEDDDEDGEEEEEEEEEEEVLRGGASMDSDMLTSTPIKTTEESYTPSEIAEIETCSTCTFSSSRTKRRIRGGKKHNKNKKNRQGNDPIGGSLERMSDILKEAKLKFGGSNTPSKNEEKNKTLAPTTSRGRTYTHTLSSIVKAIEERRKDTGNKGIFKKREPGVTEYSFQPTRREDIDREDLMAIEPPSTNYKEPILLTDITDEYHSEMRGKTVHGGGVIPFMILSRKIGGTNGRFPPPKPSTI